LSRGYAVREAADIVLLNVAVHAADALSEPTVIRGTRRGLLRFWRKPRRPNPGELHQRRLLAIRKTVLASLRMVIIKTRSSALSMAFMAPAMHPRGRNGQA
jgi:hypothetical protein